MEGVPKNYLPFVRNDDRWDIIEKIKTIILLLVLFPLRVIGTILLVTWYFINLKIGMLTIFTSNQDLSKPITSPLQNWIIQMAQPVTRILLFIMGFYNIKIRGDPSLTLNNKKSNIIVCNHTSWLDILVLMGVSNGIPGFVAKHETQHIPLIGYKSKIWQCLYVENRDKGVSGNNVSNKIIERSERDDMPPIVIFPEGTTTNGKYLLKFKTGAFISGQPVKPCSITYPAKNFSPTWETISGIYHFFRLFTQVQNYCEVSWLPVYIPTEEERKNPRLYADNVCEAIAKDLNVEMIDATYKDKLDYHRLIGFKK